VDHIFTALPSPQMFFASMRDSTAFQAQIITAQQTVVLSQVLILF